MSTPIAAAELEVKLATNYRQRNVLLSPGSGDCQFKCTTSSAAKPTPQIVLLDLITSIRRLVLFDLEQKVPIATAFMALQLLLVL